MDSISPEGYADTLKQKLEKNDFFDREGYSKELITEIDSLFSTSSLPENYKNVLINIENSPIPKVIQTAITNYVNTISLASLFKASESDPLIIFDTIDAIDDNDLDKKNFFNEVMSKITVEILKCEINQSFKSRFY